jgi:hypothetical protein
VAESAVGEVVGFALGGTEASWAGLYTSDVMSLQEFLELGNDPIQSTWTLLASARIETSATSNHRLLKTDNNPDWAILLRMTTRGIDTIGIN